MDMQDLRAQLRTGTTVYDRAGEKLGKVVELDEGGTYMLVEKGWLFPKDTNVPTSAVSEVTEEGIFLSLAKDQLEDDRYDLAAEDLTGREVVGETMEPTYAGGAVGTDVTAHATSDQMATRATRAPLAGRVAADVETMAEGDIRVPVYEEELVAGTRRAEEGRVRIHKEVVEEQQTVNVPLRQERVTVERVPADDDAITDEAFVERDFEVPVMGEEAVLSKRVKGVEEVRVHKDVVTDTERVSDTVRKERLAIDGVDAGGRAVRTSAERASGTVDRVKDAAEGAADELRRDAGRAKDRLTGR